MSAGNFRNDVDAALKGATSILEDFGTAEVRALSATERLSFVLAGAAVAMAHSLRRLAELAEEDADERQRPR